MCFAVNLIVTVDVVYYVCSRKQILVTWLLSLALPLHIVAKTMKSKNTWPNKLKDTCVIKIEMKEWE